MRFALLLIALVLASLTIAGCGQPDMRTGVAAATPQPSTSTTDVALAGVTLNLSAAGGG